MQKLKSTQKTLVWEIIPAALKSFAWSALLVLGMLCILPGSYVSAQETPESMRLKQLYYDAATQKVLNNYSKALNLYKEITQFHPSESAAYYEAADILRLQSPQMALPYAQKAFELKPDQKWYAMLYAHLLDELQRFDLSGEVYKSLYQSKKNPDYALEAADRFARSKAWSEADELYVELQKLQNYSEEAMQGRLSLLRRYNKPTKYLKKVKKFYKKYPDMPLVMGAYAEALQEADKNKEALEVYRKLRLRFPEDPKVELAMAGLFQEQYMLDSAFQYIFMAFQKKEVPLKHKITILHSFLDLSKRNAERAEQFDQLLKLIEQNQDIQDPELLAIFARRSLDKEAYEEALEYFVRITHFGNTSYDVWNHLMRIEAYLGRWKQLESHAEQAAIEFPNQPMPYLFSSTAMRYSGQYEEAVNTLLNGMAFILPEDGETRIKFHVLLGELYHELKEYSSSDAELEQAMNLRKTHAGALNTYARNLAERKERLNQALEMAELAVKISPENPEYIATKGFVLLQQNKIGEAEKTLQMALQMGGADHFRVLEQMGDLYEVKGNSSKALEFWEKARDESIYPREELLEKIEMNHNRP